MKVLIVEDEVLLAMNLQSLLEDEGHVVVGMAACFKDAVSVAETMEPDLVFLDIHLLDGTSGIEIARQLRDVDDTMVVFMTANAKKVPEDFEGAMGVISKPYTQGGLIAAIRYLGECVRRPPPSLPQPFEFTIAPAYDMHLKRLG